MACSHSALNPSKLSITAPINPNSLGRPTGPPYIPSPARLLLALVASCKVFCKDPRHSPTSLWSSVFSDVLKGLSFLPSFRPFLKIYLLWKTVFGYLNFYTPCPPTTLSLLFLVLCFSVWLITCHIHQAYLVFTFIWIRICTYSYLFPIPPLPLLGYKLLEDRVFFCFLHWLFTK